MTPQQFAKEYVHASNVDRKHLREWLEEEYLYNPLLESVYTPEEIQNFKQMRNFLTKGKLL